MNRTDTVEILPDYLSTLSLTLTTLDPPTNESRFLTEEEYLEMLNKERIVYYIPAMIFIICLMILGVIGNSFVLYVYRRRFKKTSSNYFIMTMAIFDLISCVVGMPTELYDLNNPFTFYSTVGCKIFRGCETFTNYGSAIILVEIAFDRYFKICRPLMIVRLSKIKMLCVLAVFLAMLLSISPVILFGTTRTNTSIPDVRGHDCSIAEEYKNSTFMTTYYIFLATIFVLVLIILTTLYIRIWLEIRCRREFVVRDQLARDDEPDSHQLRIRYLPSVSEDDSYNNSVIGTLRRSPSLTKVNTTSFSLHSLHSNNGRNNGNNHHQQQQQQHLLASSNNQQAHLTPRLEKGNSTNSMGDRRSKFGSLANYASRLKVTRTTVALFAVTVAFVLSYLPAIAIMVVRSVDRDFGSTQSVASLVVAKIFSNFFFINNAINPIIYSFLNINFRCQVKKAVRSIFCCCWKRSFQSVKSYSDRSTKKDYIIRD